MNKIDTAVVANRRGNLLDVIERRYDGRQALLLNDVYSRTGIEINQGELSGLLGNKSFGEKKARSLEALLDLEHGSLDGPIGTVFVVRGGMPHATAPFLATLANKVSNEDDLRLLLQVILDENPPEIPEHIRESIKSMVKTMRNLIQQSAKKPSR